MKKTYPLLFSLILWTATAIAGDGKVPSDLYGPDAARVMTCASHIWIQDPDRVPDFIEFKANAKITEENFFSVLSRSFHLPSSYGANLLHTEQDATGMEHHRFQLTVGGIPVKDAIFVLHIQDGQVVKYNGTIPYAIHIPASAQIQEQAALQNALQNIKATTYRWQTKGDANTPATSDINSRFYPKGTLCAIQKYSEINTQTFHLAWQFDIYAEKPLSRNNVYVDAISGEILRRDNLIETANTAATAVTVYRGPRAIQTDSYSGSYRLRETTRVQGINTYNMHTTTDYNSATDFTNATTTWNNINTDLDQYAGDAHWGAEMTMDFYKNTFGRNGIDAAGFAMNLYVHYDLDYVNAFWDGQEMNFGDGDGVSYTPLVSLDVTGHEISHGLTQYTAALNYQDESGAMNEGFSDCMGTAVEYYGDSSRANWTIGEDLGTPFRSMSSPKLYQQPDTYLGQYWYTGAQDNGGVHTNSGVENHWYYLLATGGTGTNDNNNTYSVTGIGRAKATAIIWRMQTVYLVPTSQYADARFYSLQAATDLYGACSPEVQSTANAWYACGVGTTYTPTVSTAFAASNSVGCTVPFIVNFTNQSSNTSNYTWYFGDGDTSHATSPSHTYTTQGIYTVKLVASGGCGADSITQANLINVNTNNPCQVILPTLGSAPLQTACAGVIYDDGGPHAAYSDNDNSSVTISPLGASNVRLNFASLRIEQNYDYLYIYDGPGISSPLIGTYTGYTAPAAITSSGSSITVQFISDEAVEDSGFAINWTCIAATSPPVTDFTSDDTTTCSGDIQFYDLTTGGVSSWLWTFGDGTTSTLQNPLKTYATNGVYTVSLTATNGIGSNTKTKNSQITVNKPPAPSVPDVSRSGTGSVVLTANTTNNVNWYAGINDTTPVGVSNPFTTPSISVTTDYYAEEVVKQTPYAVGPADSTIGSGSYFNGNAQRALRFKVNRPSKLVSVYVYPNTTGYRTVEYRDTFGNVIVSRSVYMQAPSGRVNLNINLKPSAAAVYELGVADSADLFRNTGGGAYPYNDAGGLVSIIGNNIGSAANAGYYYYFYDWRVAAPDCISERATTTAIVYPAGIVETAGSFTASVYPNPASSQIQVRISADQASTLSISIRDMLGQVITARTFDNQTDIAATFDVSGWASGVYAVEIRSDQTAVTKQIVISK